MVLTYRLLDGRKLDLRGLSRADLEFVLDLQARALAGEDFFTLEMSVCGRGAYPLKGSPRVTSEVHATKLFRVAEDVAFRTGILQGFLAPAGARAPDKLVGVADAAKRLGISRAAVVKALKAGRLRGERVGKAWAIPEESVGAYRVAKARVAAGKAAARKRRRGA